MSISERERVYRIGKVLAVVSVCILAFVCMPRELEKSFIQDTKKVKVDKKNEIKKENKDRSVGAEEKNVIPFTGLESRNGRVSTVTSSGKYIFNAYADYVIMDGDWADSSNNIYIRVAYEVDTSKCSKNSDLNSTATLTAKIPKECTLLTNTVSVSDGSISTNYANNLMTFTWTKGLGYSEYHLSYIYKVNYSQVPASIINSYDYINTIASTIVRQNDSGKNGAVLKTSNNTQGINSNPRLQYIRNYGPEQIFMSSGPEYHNYYNTYVYGAIATKLNGNSYDANGNPYFMMKVCIDMTSGLGTGAYIDGSFSMPSLFEFVPGSISCGSSGMTCTVNNNNVYVKVTGMQPKAYYATYWVTCKIKEIPFDYISSKWNPQVYISGPYYDYNLPRQVAFTGVHESNNTIYMNAVTCNVVMHAKLFHETNGGFILGQEDLTAYYRLGKVTNLFSGSSVSKPGYTFDGWYRTPDFSGPRVTQVGSMERDDIYLYAKWRRNAYKVTLYPNGGTIAPGANVTSYEQGVGATLPNASQMSKTGYTFYGWYNNPQFTGYRYGSIGTLATGDREYWARWTPNSYKVTLETNGGTVNSGNVTSYTYGVGATLPNASQVSKVGHNFKGWYDNKDFNGNPITSIGKTELGDKTFYAKWEPCVYEVVLYPNGGTITNGKNITQYTYGAGAKLPNGLEIRKEASEFVGWYDNPEFNGTPVTHITTTDLGKKEYWAKWNTFELNIEDSLFYVYGVSTDSSIYKSQSIEFEIKTKSKQNMTAYLTREQNPKSEQLTTPEKIEANETEIIGVPDSISSSVASSKDDVVIYLQVDINCKGNDGEKDYQYDINIQQKVTLRYVTSYKQG